MNFRAVGRLLRVAAHVGRGVLTVIFVYPRCDETRKLVLKQQWSMRLLDIVGIAMKWSGDLPADVPTQGLLISNHISFMDVFAINAIMPSSFVAKSEVRSWPLIGWLARHTDTLFIRRGSHSAAQRALKSIAEHLRTGKCVTVFPEGTTSMGDAVLHFHSAMFQAAIDAGVDISPIAISYTNRFGDRSYDAAFVGETTLVSCLWSIARAQGITVHVTILPPQKIDGYNRRQLASLAQQAIGEQINPSIQSSAAAATAAAHFT